MIGFFWLALMKGAGAAGSAIAAGAGKIASATQATAKVASAASNLQGAVSNRGGLGLVSELAGKAAGTPAQPGGVREAAGNLASSVRDFGQQPSVAPTAAPNAVQAGVRSRLAGVPGVATEPANLFEAAVNEFSTPQVRSAQTRLGLTPTGQPPSTPAAVPTSAPQERNAFQRGALAVADATSAIEGRTPPSVATAPAQPLSGFQKGTLGVSDVAAAIRGRTPPSIGVGVARTNADTARMRAEQEAFKQRAINWDGATRETINRVTQLSLLPEGQREAELADIRNDNFQRFGQSGLLAFDALIDNPAISALDVSEQLAINPNLGFLLATDAEKFGEEYAKSVPDFVAAADRKQLPEIANAVQAQFAYLRENDKAALDALGPEVSLLELQANPAIPENLKLSVPQSDTAMRHQQELAQFGITPTEISAAGAEAAAKERPGRHVNFVHPNPVEGQQPLVAARPNSPEADALVAQGYVAGGQFGDKLKDAFPGIDKSALAKYEQAYMASGDFLTLSKKTRQIIADRPETTSALGGLSTLFNSLGAELKAAKNVAFGNSDRVRWEEGGKEIALTAESFEDRVLDVFGDDAIDGIIDRFKLTAKDRGRVRSLVVGLAYSAAAARGQAGRAASDRDIQNFKERIGESSDPEVFSAVLLDMEDETIGNFNSFHRLLFQRAERSGEQNFPEEPGNLRVDFGLVPVEQLQQENAVAGMKASQLKQFFLEQEGAGTLTPEIGDAIKARMADLGIE